MAIAEAQDALAIVHFLLVYDGQSGRLERCDRFDDEGAAIAAYAAAEAEHGGRQQVEVVLLGADTLETITRTHGQYFASNTVSGLPSAEDL